VDATGGLGSAAPAEVRLVLGGDAANAMRLGLAKMSPTDVQRVLKQSFSQWMDIASVTSQSDSATGEERFILTGSASLDWPLNKVVGAQQYDVEDAKLSGSADFSRPDGPRRDAPFAVPYPLFLRVHEEIVLPPGGEASRSSATTSRRQSVTLSTKEAGASTRASLSSRRTLNPSRRSFRRPMLRRSTQRYASSRLRSCSSSSRRLCGG